MSACRGAGTPAAHFPACSSPVVSPFDLRAAQVDRPRIPFCSVTAYIQQVWLGESLARQSCDPARSGERSWNDDPISLGVLAHRVVRWRNPGLALAVGIAAAVFAGLPWTAPRLVLATPVTAELRPRFSKVVLDGYCPVVLCNQRAWQKGDKAFRTVHEGCIYQFVGRTEQKAFEADPAKFSVVLCGCDVVLAKEDNQLIDGAREHGLWYENKTYLFASEESLRRFQQDPRAYATFVKEKGARLVNRFIDRGPDNNREGFQPEAEIQTADH
jgi:YHS domain-containing protein